jgi:peptidoglycan hydrolase CwlO-like protein
MVMINYLTFISVGELTFAAFLGLKPEGVFILFALVLLAIILVGIYLIITHYKKDSDFKWHDLTARINSLKLQKDNLAAELVNLKEKVEKDEKKWSEWKAEKEKLIQEIEDLKKQMLEITKKKDDTKNDVIIEYYMNDNDTE